MSRALHLANAIERTVTGPMWHGPALNDVLKGLTPAQASARPLPDAHTIWEITLHVIAWCEIARERIKGRSTGDPTAEQDWPAPAGTWDAVLPRLVESHRELAADTQPLADAELNARVPGLDYSVDVLLRGIVEHGTYHAGQIALLRKA